MAELDETLEAVEAAMERDDLDEALRLARHAVRDFPTEPDALLTYGEVLTEAGDLRAACEAYETATRLAPDDAILWCALAWAEFMLLDFDAARRDGNRANTLEATPHGWNLLGRLEEREGRMAEADRCFQRAFALDPESFPLPLRLPEAEFRDVVAAALDRLPDEFRAALDGEVAVLVEPVPSVDVLQSGDPAFDPEILGLYVGIALPDRDSTQIARLPDVVYLFQRNLEHAAGDREELLDEIAVTVYHEVGHYLGYDDDELDEMGIG